VEPRYSKIGIDEFGYINLTEADSAHAVNFSMNQGIIAKSDCNYWCGNDSIDTTIALDAFIIHGNNFWLLEEMRDVQTHEIILTGEVKPKWIEKWKEEGLRRKIPVHVTGEQGAKVIDF
jgi:hypothetical protein